MDTKMYVTGGLGPSAHNEGFTHDYDLPNETAYAETCASVALIFWAQRMLHLDLDGKYADMLELALFNGALAGLSRDGEHYFYENPLESDGTPTALGLAHLPVLHDERRRGSSPRSAAISSPPRADGIAVPPLWRHLDRRSRSAGTKVALRETSNYPWSGDIDDRDRPGDADRLRREAAHSRLVPRRHGCGQRRGGDAAATTSTAISTINRTWNKGDVVTLDLPMPAERLYAHPGVIMDAGRVALKRGPLVYCVEEADNPGGRVQRLKLPREAELRGRRRADLFDGIVTLSATGDRHRRRRLVDALPHHARPGRRRRR